MTRYNNLMILLAVWNSIIISIDHLQAYMCASAVPTLNIKLSYVVTGVWSSLIPLYVVGGIPPTTSGEYSTSGMAQRPAGDTSSGSLRCVLPLCIGTDVCMRL